MKNLILPILLLFSLVSFSQSGVAINSTGSAPAGSAMLDIQSTSKGVLVPRMTSAQRAAISSPANGLLVFDSTTESFWFYSGVWTELIDQSNSGWAQKNDTVSATRPYVGIGTSNPTRMLTLNFNNANLNTSHFLIEQAGTGDSWFNIGLTGAKHYALGIDNSDGDKFKIGYNATAPGALHSNTRMTIDTLGNIGIGISSMNDRLHINSVSSQNPFRADVSGVAKFLLHSNGGASVGSSTTPPVNGLRVAGAIDPVGGVSSVSNITVTSNAGYVSFMAGGSEIRLYASGQIDINSAGDLNINSAGTLSLSGSGVSIQSSSDVSIQSAIDLVLDSDRDIDILANRNIDMINTSGTMNVQTTTGNMNVQTNNGNMNVQTNNGNMNVKNTGGILNVSSSSTLNLDGATVDINNGINGAARVLDPVGGVILIGSATVKIGN